MKTAMGMIPLSLALGLSACDAAPTRATLDDARPSAIEFCSSSGDCGPDPIEPSDSTEWSNQPVAYGQPYSGYSILSREHGGEGTYKVETWAGNKNIQNIAYSRVNATFRLWKEHCDRTTPSNTYAPPPLQITGSNTQGDLDITWSYDTYGYRNFKVGVEATHQFVASPGYPIYQTNYYTNWNKCFSVPF